MTESKQNAPIWHQLVRGITAAWPPARWRDVGVVVGCSGGADSVGLLTALHQIRQSDQDGQAIPPRGFLVAAHFNHGLRADQSDGDQEFVRDLANRLQVRFASESAHSSAGGDQSSKRGVEPRDVEGPAKDEATMRSARMKFLVHTAHRLGARYIVLGHTADDNVETVLHHLMRGTGPAGLAGIGSPRPVSDDLVLVRPMLDISRQSIRDALQEHRQPWREDASNDDTDYRRNWIRHELVPMIQSQYPDSVDAIQRAVEGQRQWRSVIDRLAKQWLDQHLLSQEPVSLRRDPLAETAVVVAATQSLWQTLEWPRGDMAREHWLRLAATIGAPREPTDPCQRYTLPGCVDVLAGKDSIEIRRIPVEAS